MSWARHYAQDTRRYNEFHADVARAAGVAPQPVKTAPRAAQGQGGHFWMNRYEKKEDAMDTALVPVTETPKSIALAPVPAMPRSIMTMTDSQFNRLTIIAKMCAASQLSYAKNGSNKMTEGDIFLVMLKGVEVGLEPMAAMDSIDLISGKPTLDPQGMLALINRSGQLDDISIDATDQRCVVMMKRKGRTPHTETFTVEDATRMGLTGRDNWKKQQRTMIKWRCVAACARIVFPDVVQGLYTSEELGADVNVTDDGRMTVIAPPETVKPAEPKPAATPPADNGVKSETTATAEASATAYDIGKVVNLTAFMHRDPTHARNTLNMLVESGDITPTMTDEIAAAMVFKHRCEKDYGLTMQVVGEILSDAVDDAQGGMTLNKWIKSGRDLKHAWREIDTYMTLKDTPPAAPKSNPFSKQLPKQKAAQTAEKTDLDRALDGEDLLAPPDDELPE